MNNILGLKDRVETSGIFRNWIARNPKAYFYLIFTMFERLNLAEFELAYYAPSSKNATVFAVGSTISIKEEDKVYGGDIPQKLELAKLKLGLPEAISKASELATKTYPHEIPIKTIAMLQMQEGRLQWNIIFFTMEFSTLNVRVDAASGKILKHSLQKLFDFVK